jgi:acyl carrier protein
MATIEQFIAHFQTAVDFQEAVDVTPDTEFAGLSQWDSIAALGVIVMMDMEYGKTITGEHLATCKTVRELYSLIG